MSAMIDKVIVTGLLLTVVFTALAYGTVEAWSVAVFELAIIALASLWLIKSYIDRRFTVTVPQAALPVAGLILIGLAQSFTFRGAGGQVASLSSDPEATRMAVTVMLFLLASFIMAANFFNTRERLSMLGNFLVVYGFAMALFALVQHLAWDGRFYWVRPSTQGGSPFGSFVNHSHFAGYMEMLAPFPLAMLLTGAVKRDARLLYAFAAALMVIAIIASLSRGGWLALAAEMAFIIIASLWMKKSRLKFEAAERERVLSTVNSAGVAGLVLALLLGMIWIGPDPVIDRVTGSTSSTGITAATDGETFYASRGWIWRDTLELFGSSPVLGVGLGAFQTAYTAYSDGDGSLAVNAAHNDYLQVLAETGIVGALVTLWFITATVVAIKRGLKARDPRAAAMALASGAGLVALLVHSVFDFNLQLPSNALLFLLLSAVSSTVASIAQAREPKQQPRVLKQAV